MTTLFEPLNDDELDWLDRFLLERITDEEGAVGKDEGVLDISELDGFFTALVSGPESIPPSRWLPALWGDCVPVWETAEEFERVMSLLLRHMNDIASVLMESPADFEPMFLERTVEDKVYTIVDEWCEGYVRGISLAAEAWGEGGLEMDILLAPIRGFSSETDWRAHDFGTDHEVTNLQQAITPNAREIHARWFAQRKRSLPSQAPSRRAAPRIGRNDPCPCGSGKKYKKCCLH